MSESYQHYLAICAIFRDESPYLAEWVALHQLVGVDHFFLYDNASGDEPETVLRPWIDRGVVTLRRWPVPFHQHAARGAYEDCLNAVRGRVRWLACLDLDEFLFSPAESRLPPVLSEYEGFPGVVVRWQVYGSSGHERTAPEPVIARFCSRAPRSWIRNRRVKSIVDPARALRPVNPHHFVYRDRMLAVDEQKRTVELVPRPRFKKSLRPIYRLLGPMLQYVDPYSGTDISLRTISVQRLRINHYPVKSREEFLRKASYKKEKKRYDGVDYFAYHDRNDVYDPILTRYLPELQRVLPQLDANGGTYAARIRSSPNNGTR